MSETTAASSCSLKKSYTCKFPSCTNSYYKKVPEGFKQKKFFRFPRDPSRAAVWKQICLMPPTATVTNYYICSDHFSPSNFSNPKDPHPRLNFQAVPKYVNNESILGDHCYTGNFLSDSNFKTINEEIKPDQFNSNVTVNINSNEISESSCTLVKVHSCKFPSSANAYYKNVPEGFKQKKFFRFPRDPSRAAVWKQICCISSTEEVDNYYMCSDHFVTLNVSNPKEPFRLDESILDDHCYTVNSYSILKTTNKEIKHNSNLSVNIKPNDVPVSSCPLITAYSCKFPSCANAYHKNVPEGFKQKKFFRFPRDPSRAAVWKQICSMSSTEEVDNYYICSDHFLPLNVSNPEELFSLNFKTDPKFVSNESIIGDHCYTGNSDSNLTKTDEEIKHDSNLSVNNNSNDVPVSSCPLIKAYSCKFPSCANTYNKNVPEGFKQKKFFRLPRDRSLAAVWKQICHVCPTEKVHNFYICSDHFSPLDFCNPEKPSRLNCKAVPKSVSENSILPNHCHTKKFSSDPNSKTPHEEMKPDPNNSNESVINTSLSTVHHENFYLFDSSFNPNDKAVSSCPLEKSYTCKFPSCTNSYYKKVPEGFKQKKFFRFPRDPSRAAVWKQICLLPPTATVNNYYICSDHFSPSNFSNPKDPRPRLNFQAVPKFISKESTLLDLCHRENFFSDSNFKTGHEKIKPNRHISNVPANNTLNALSSAIHDHCYLLEEKSFNIQ